MSGHSLSLVAAFAAAAFALPAAADTVAWWHFDESDPGITAANNTIACDQAPTTYADVRSYAGNSASAGLSEYKPVFTRPFPGLAVYDPVADSTRDNLAAMKFTIGRGGDNPSANSGRAYHGGALKFNGASTLYSSCTGAITVETFVCTTGGVYNTFAPIIGCVPGDSWTSEKWAIYMENDGTLAVRFNGSVWYSGNNGAGKAKVNDGIWHHVAITWDGTYVKVYVDYVLDKKTSDSSDRIYGKGGTIPYDSNCATHMGGYATYSSSDGGRKFPGVIDEVRVSDAALAPSQFLRLVDLNTDPDTVLHLRFDSDTTRALENGEVVGGTIGGVQAIYYAVSGADSSTYAISEKAGAIASGLYADSSVANASSFCQFTNATGKANYVKAPALTNALFPNGVPSPTNLNYTIEAFFKTKGEGQIRQNVLKFGTNYRPAQFVMGDENHPHQLQFSYAKGADPAWASDSPYTPADKPCDDGNWHHVAFVSDASNKLVRAYYDYELVSTQTGVYLPVAKSYSLFVGSSENGGGQFFDGWIDDVRVTKRVLRPDEFLTAHPVGSATQPLLTSLLEQNYGFACATDSYWTVTGAGAARSGGTAPVFEKTSRGSLLLDGTNGTVSAVNEWSARMNRSNIVFPASPFYEQDAYTVEFWAKFNGFSDTNGEREGDDETLSAHVGILRFVQGDTTTFDWYMFREKSNAKRIQLVPRQANNSMNYDLVWDLPQILADGKWHHYAVAFERNAGNTSADITLYYDFESLGTRTSNGIYKSLLGHRLMVCESSDPDPNILGNIDAIRFWRGNPAPSQFLGRVPSAFMLMVR